MSEPAARAPSVLSDLVATRESPHPPAAPAPMARRRRRPAPRRRVNPFYPAEQRSLFGEILDWMFAPLMLLWPLSVAVTFVVARSLTDAPFDRTLIDRVEVLRERITAGETDSRAQLLPLLERLARAQDGSTLRIQVAGPEGRIVAGDSGLARPGLYDFPAPERIRLRTVVDNGVEWRVAYTWASPSDLIENGLLLIQVADNFDNRDQLASEIIRGVLFPQFMILPLSLLLVWFGLSRGLAPMKLLQRKIQQRRPDDLSLIDPKEAPEELTPLVVAFNDLLARQEQTLQAQRRFIADAAHQLKTPLAGLRTQSELAMRETNADELRRTLEHIASSAERSAHTVSQLLALARTENLRHTVAMDELDLAPLVRTVIADHYSIALEKSIDLGFESDDLPAPITGHPILLREMIGNLIDNAIRYTPAGGIVTARVQTTPADVVLEIEDDGIGIAPADRELVFNRFFRVLGAGADGSGLGLSIVREIVGQHGAAVAISDGLIWPTLRGAGTGSRFTVRFPKFNDEGL